MSLDVEDPDDAAEAHVADARALHVVLDAAERHAGLAVHEVLHHRRHEHERELVDRRVHGADHVHVHVHAGRHAHVARVAHCLRRHGLRTHEVALHPHVHVAVGDHPLVGAVNVSAHDADGLGAGVVLVVMVVFGLGDRRRVAGLGVGLGLRGAGRPDAGREDRERERVALEVFAGSSGARRERGDVHRKSPFSWVEGGLGAQLGSTLAFARARRRRALEPVFVTAKAPASGASSPSVARGDGVGGAVGPKARLTPRPIRRAPLARGGRG